MMHSAWHAFLVAVAIAAAATPTSAFSIHRTTSKQRTAARRDSSLNYRYYQESLTQDATSDVDYGDILQATVADGVDAIWLSATNTVSREPSSDGTNTATHVDDDSTYGMLLETAIKAFIPVAMEIGVTAAITSSNVQLHP